ncbi:hypothetical protein JZU61_06300 [bacterium]|nr:hypothetical protein [bacterium]
MNNKKFPEVIQWLAEKRIDPSGLVSHVMPYTDVERGMDLFSNHPEEVCKIIFLNCKCKLNTLVKWQQPQAA